MNNKKTYLIYLLLAAAIGLLPIKSYAQNTVAEQKAEEIKADTAYIYGEGWGKSHKIADKQALSDLISKISVTISSSIDITEKEINIDGEVNSETAVNSVVNTYATATLNNTEVIDISLSPEFRVMRYVKKSEIDKIFEQRKEKVYDFLRSANKAEANFKIGDALRYYYWGYNMLKSLRYPNSISFTDENGDKHLLSVYIPQKMNEIFDDLKMVTTKRNEKGNELEVYVTYKGAPVTNVGFTYHDGLHRSYIHEVKDGIGEIILHPSAKMDNVNIQYEYEYEGETHIDKEVETVMEMFKGTPFPRSNTIVSTQPTKVIKTEDMPFVSEAIILGSPETSTSIASTTSTSAATDESKTKKMAEIVAKVTNALKKKNHEGLKTYFTEEGWDMYEKLLKYGNAKMVGEANFSFYPLGESVVCRSIPMSFTFSNNKRQFIEPVTLTFNKNGLIEAMAFGLGSEAQTNIFDKAPGIWSDESKMILATFLENYKTAFALKRLDFIENLFDDDAVIITGHVLKKKSNSIESQKYIENKHVVYNRLTKKEYIKKLKMCFNSNEYINIRFTDNDIVKMGKGGEVYGIQIHQDYYSTNYGDTGYLFLLVDINNPKQPTIYIRTWQPERDPNINDRLPRNHPDYGLYGPGYF